MINPYYEHAGITIYHGDCREILPGLPKVDLVLTDPPWNLNYFKDDDKDWSEYARWLGTVKDACLEKTQGPCIIFQSTKAIGHIAHLFKDWEMFASVKNFCQMFTTKLPNAFDLAFISHSRSFVGQGRNWHIGNNANRKNVCSGHPTSRPFDTIKYLLSMFEAETILDPFMGSGTTLVAAKELGRKAIGIEIEEKYCEIVVRRLQQEVLNFK